jgi:hypothetical protein
MDIPGCDFPVVWRYLIVRFPKPLGSKVRDFGSILLHLLLVHQDGYTERVKVPSLMMSRLSVYQAASRLRSSYQLAGVRRGRDGGVDQGTPDGRCTTSRHLMLNIVAHARRIWNQLPGYQLPSGSDAAHNAAWQGKSYYEPAGRLQPVGHRIDDALSDDACAMSVLLACTHLHPLVLRVVCPEPHQRGFWIVNVRDIGLRPTHLGARGSPDGPVNSTACT